MVSQGFNQGIYRKEVTSFTATQNVVYGWIVVHKLVLVISNGINTEMESECLETFIAI